MTLSAFLIVGRGPVLVYWIINDLCIESLELNSITGVIYLHSYKFTGRFRSHTCRRSFCTNEFLAGTPVELIMKISGHRSLKDFYRYIKISPEEAAGKIKKIWAERGELNLY